MTCKEILAVTESDQKGCEIINKLVHEKLGLYWHEYDLLRFPQCNKCGSIDPNPDYTHDISATWAIKEWLDKQPYYEDERYHFHLLDTTRATVWASPLNRCKAFLLMEVK